MFCTVAIPPSPPPDLVPELVESMDTEGQLYCIMEDTAQSLGGRWQQCHETRLPGY